MEFLLTKVLFSFLRKIPNYMELSVLLSFIVVSVGLIFVPGPNVLLIVSTSIAHGRKRGLQTVIGTTSGMAVQLTITALGTVGLINLLSNSFFWIKWVGIAYLVYLGIRHLTAFRRPSTQAPPISSSGSFLIGFLISISNPKTMLFFAAFLPQFVNPSSPSIAQVAILSSIFLFLGVVIDSMYAILADKFGLLTKNNNAQNGRNLLSGIIYLGIGFGLAVTKRT